MLEDFNVADFMNFLVNVDLDDYKRRVMEKIMGGDGKGNGREDEMEKVKTFFGAMQGLRKAQMGDGGSLVGLFNEIPDEYVNMLRSTLE